QGCGPAEAGLEAFLAFLDLRRARALQFRCPRFLPELLVRLGQVAHRDALAVQLAQVALQLAPKVISVPGTFLVGASPFLLQLAGYANGGLQSTGLGAGRVQVLGAPLYVAEGRAYAGAHRAADHYPQRKFAGCHLITSAGRWLTR